MLENNVVEDMITYYVFVKKGRRHFDPQCFSAGLTTLQWIFPVPESHSVGTLDKHSNGIVFIKFSGYGKDTKSKVVAKDYAKNVYDWYYYRFCPNFTDDTIAYSQNRFAVIANIKTGETFYAESDLLRGSYILGIRFLEPRENLFALVKSIMNEYGYGWEDYLHIVKLEGRQFIDTAWSMKLGMRNDVLPYFPLYNTWFVHNHKLFVLDRDKEYSDRILCTDGKQPIPHPFSEIYNANSNSIGKIKDIAIHPTLPFGVMIEERSSFGVLHGLVIVRWDIKGPDEQIARYSKMFDSLASLFGLEESMALAYSSFSPCGNWYVVSCIVPNEPHNPYFIALPVDPEHPDLLVRKDIVVLGQVKGMTSLAWTSNPTSYVVSNGELLHKWDLEELPNARVFVMPGEDDGGKKASIFRRIRGLFEGKK